MLVSDYIVSFLSGKKITDVFGYPGGMVTYLMDSFSKYSDKIRTHVAYHEQGAAFAACGYAQVSGLPGVAYATSGPGATNLLTGIANSYFDSIPCIFITGQVNTYESKGNLKVRQKGFQETDIVAIAKSITKYAAQITDASKIKYELEKAFYVSREGRPGPVLLDIPMNIQRTDVTINKLKGFKEPKAKKVDYQKIAKNILEELAKAKKPLIIAGAGISGSHCNKEFQQLIKQLRIPVVTSMIGIDALPSTYPMKYGFIGAYGHRWANFITNKSDLILTMGTRLDCRQTGSNKDNFACKAKIIRIDVDPGEITNRIKAKETDYICDLQFLLPVLNKLSAKTNSNYANWIKECNTFRTQLKRMDSEPGNKFIKEFSNKLNKKVIVTTDVGQNQVWAAQSFEVKNGQSVLFSGGHGAMGYSLPAAIGAYYASHKPVICLVGDGGLQMNIQELQFIVREKLPIKIVLLNNHSLGMIRHFQEMYFNSNYVQTTAAQGYTIPDFCKIFRAYGIKSKKCSNVATIIKACATKEPVFFDVELGKKTYVFPKLAINKPIHDQEPLMDRKLFEKLDSEKF